VGGRVIEEKQQNNKEGAATSSIDTKYTYDNMANLIMVEQVNGTQGSQFTQYYYGLKGRVLRTYTGLTSPLTINGLDSVTPNGDNSYDVTKYAYDFYGNITSYTDGDGNTENYQYNDLTGQLTVKILRNLATITYTYDNAGNILKIICTQSGKTTLTNTYTYDLAGSLLEAKNASCDTNYIYDDAGRLTTETDAGCNIRE
jgi:YD repeat-containing protein